MPLGLVATPDRRRLHDGIIPLVGGLALTLAAIIALLAYATWSEWPGNVQWWFLVAVLAMVVSGAIDDARELSARSKGLIQSATALVLALTGSFTVSSVGDLFGAGAIHLEFLVVPFTVLVLVGYINALNMIDGADGLAGGLSLVQIAFLALTAWQVHADRTLAVLLAIGGGLLGFLAFNFPVPGRRQAKVYLGDGGTQVLALVIGCCAMRLTGAPQTGGLRPMAVAWILALPVMDTLAVMLVRIVSGRSPLSGDRQHLHHILMDLGMRPSSVTYLLIAVGTTYGAFGLVASDLGVQDWVLFAVFIMMLLWHTGLVVASRSALGRIDAFGVDPRNRALIQVLPLVTSATSDLDSVASRTSVASRSSLVSMSHQGVRPR